jgi:hypothetical protein
MGVMTQTRTELENQLATLRRGRGAATLAGKKFDHAVIAEAEAELDALEDATNEQARLRRAAAEATRQKQLEILKVELSALARSYLADAEAAEACARSGAAALGRMLQTAQQMARISHQISGRETPIPLLGTELERRLGARHAAVMSTIPGHRHRLGAIEWLAGHYTPETNWRDAEAALLARHVQPLYEKEANDGPSSSKD